MERLSEKEFKCIVAGRRCLRLKALTLPRILTRRGLLWMRILSIKRRVGGSEGF